MTPASPLASKRLLVAGNWKMNHDHLEAIRLVQELGLRLGDGLPEGVAVSVHPPFTDLRSVQSVIADRSLPFLLGAQNCHQERSGAFTGEVSAGMLRRLDVSLVIVGHSERRRLFGEDDDLVAAKLRAVIDNDMTPILCVGESEEERDAGSGAERIASQVRAGVRGLAGRAARNAAGRGVEARGGKGGQAVGRRGKGRDGFERGGQGRGGFEGPLVVAYEPVWAIGTGRAATPEDAAEGAKVIREALASAAGESVADSALVLYGGSVDPANASELTSAPGVNGLLVGGASLQAESFHQVILEAAGASTSRR